MGPIPHPPSIDGPFSRLPRYLAPTVSTIYDFLRVFRRFRLIFFRFFFFFHPAFWSLRRKIDLYNNGPGGAAAPAAPARVTGKLFSDTGSGNIFYIPD